MSLGQKGELVRRVHVEEVFRRHNNLTQIEPAEFGVDRLEKATGRVERYAESALLPPVECRGVPA